MHALAPSRGQALARLTNSVDGALVKRIELVDRAERAPDQGAGDDQIDGERFQAGDKLVHDAVPTPGAMLRVYG